MYITLFCSLTLHHSPSLPQVFEAMISWIKHDKPARLEYMPKLMEHVRLPLLSRDYLVQVKEILPSALLSLNSSPLILHHCVIVHVTHIKNAFRNEKEQTERHQTSVCVSVDHPEQSLSGNT